VELLEHEHAIGSRPAHGHALEAHAALGRRHVAAHGLEQGRLAAAGGPEQHEAVGPEDIEADAIGGGDEMLLGLVLQRHAVHLQQRRASLVGGFGLVRGHQLPGSPWTSGKNRSFQLSGFTLIDPTANMKSAYFIVFSGTMVHLTCLPEAISATFSTGILDLTLSIQACEASFTSLPSISVASWKAATRAL